MNKKIENIDCFIEINNSSVEILNKVKSLNFHETCDKEGKTIYNLEVLPSEIIPRINFKVNENVEFDLNLNISIKENAKLEFLDESTYNSDSNIIILTHMLKNSLFELYRLNKFNDSSINSYFHKCELSESCLFKDYNFTNGSKQMSDETVVILGDKYAHYVGSGVVIADSTNCNNILKINHNSQSSISDCSFKTVSRGSANVTFNGKVFVDKDCSKTVSNQVSKGLIMDKEARVTLMPKLEINNDDVLCSHGAASGQPDESVIYYLTSRGIKRKEAERIYVQGFLGEFLDKIDNAQMRAKAKQYISLNS